MSGGGVFVSCGRPDLYAGAVAQQTVNEAVLAWYRSEGGKPLKITALVGTLKIAEITEVRSPNCVWEHANVRFISFDGCPDFLRLDTQVVWPLCCDPAEEKKRSKCFQVACGDTLHLFAAAKGTDALAWVRRLNVLRKYL